MVTSHYHGSCNVMVYSEDGDMRCGGRNGVEWW